MGLHDDPFHIFIDIHIRGNTNFHKDQPSSATFTKLPPTFVRLILTRLSRDDYLPLSPFDDPLPWSSEKDASCRVLLYKHLEDCRIKQPFQHDVLQTNLFTDKVPAKLDLPRPSGVSWISCRHLTVDPNMYFDRNGW